MSGFNIWNISLNQVAQDLLDIKYCPRCRLEMTPVSVENPTRYWWEEAGGWQESPPKKAWYCEPCMFIIEDDTIPFSIPHRKENRNEH